MVVPEGDWQLAPLPTSQVLVLLSVGRIDDQDAREGNVIPPQTDPDQKEAVVSPAWLASPSLNVTENRRRSNIA
jgi:hypothetical protein